MAKGGWYAAREIKDGNIYTELLPLGVRWVWLGKVRRELTKLRAIVGLGGEAREKCWPLVIGKQQWQTEMLTDVFTVQTGKDSTCNIVLKYIHRRQNKKQLQRHHEY